MFIKVFDNCAEMIFEGDSEEFLDENGWWRFRIRTFWIR